jgi:putative ABC transport system ATP-binding protein
MNNSNIEEAKTDIIIEAKKLTKMYYLDTTELLVLKEVDLVVKKGEFLFIMGPSGSGKTTLMNLIGGIDRVTSGSIKYYLTNSSNNIFTEDITSLSEGKLTSFRRAHLSYIFQFYSLIPTLTASENVQLMCELIGIKGRKLKQESEYWLKVVGLQQRMNSFPGQLSGGERQRVAIARALAKNPEVILADEPTGQLDHSNGRLVVETLYNVCKTMKKTVIMVTHDYAYKDLATRILNMSDGKIIEN